MGPAPGSRLLDSRLLRCSGRVAAPLTAETDQFDSPPRLRDRHGKAGDETHKAPGPGRYEMPSSIGKQAMSSKSNSEKWRFPTANRWSNTKKDFSDHFGTPAARDFKPANGWLGDSAKFSFSGEAKRYGVGKGSPGVEPSFLKADRKCNRLRLRSPPG